MFVNCHDHCCQLERLFCDIFMFYQSCGWRKLTRLSAFSANATSDDKLRRDHKNDRLPEILAYSHNFASLTWLNLVRAIVFCHLLSRMKASLFSGQKAIEQGKRKPGLVKEVTRLSSLPNTATSLGTLHPNWFATRLDGHFRWGLHEIYIPPSR